MKYLLTAAIAVFLMSGCQALAPQITKAAGKVQEGVDTYCDEVDEKSRANFRAKVNPTPGGATIVVTCPNE